MNIRICLATLSILLAGCAARLPPLPVDDLFNDAAVGPPSQPVGAEQLFTLSPEMRAHMQSERFRAEVRTSGAEAGLVDAMYSTRGGLRLDYDASVTRDAAGTYAAKKGNCLSLVIMTAAFAKELKLHVTYQNVLMAAEWSRQSGLYVASTHVNLAVADPGSFGGRTTIDFVPPDQAGKQRIVHLDERTIEAMYLNNRAVEEMAQGRLDDAYWWARAAVAKDPFLVTAYNTLGVIYQRRGEHVMAERTYQRALARAPEDLMLMGNLVQVLTRLGKGAESKALALRMASIEPTPPFHYFELGMKAMEAGQFGAAKSLFAREVRRAPYYHEFHYWLAIAHLRLGEAGAARSEMAAALNTSPNADMGKRYSAKLEHLRALVPRTGLMAN